MRSTSCPSRRDRESSKSSKSRSPWLASGDAARPAPPEHVHLGGCTRRSFREDLLYALNVVSHRRFRCAIVEDLLLFTTTSLGSTRSVDRSVTSRRALSRLAYLAGQCPRLENVIERAMLFDGEELSVGHLPDSLSADEGADPRLPGMKSIVERELIKRALDERATSPTQLNDSRRPADECALACGPRRSAFVRVHPRVLQVTLGVRKTDVGLALTVVTLTLSVLGACADLRAPLGHDEPRPTRGDDPSTAALDFGFTRRTPRSVNRARAQMVYNVTEVANYRSMQVIEPRLKISLFSRLMLYVDLPIVNWEQTGPPRRLTAGLIYDGRCRRKTSHSSTTRGPAHPSRLCSAPHDLPTLDVGDFAFDMLSEIADLSKPTWHWQFNAQPDR